MTHRQRKWLLVFVTIVIAVWIALQAAATYTEAINWDEFALGYRAERTLATNTLHRGGRMGLVTILLTPLVRDCINSIETVRNARLLWVVVTLLYFVGFGLFLTYLRKQMKHPISGVILGVALLAFVPVVLRWSLQVRTDQLALAAGLWAGLFLLKSETRTVHAVVAGFLLGLGGLCSQKAIYVTGLIGIATLGNLYIHRSFVWRRELLRAALFFATVLGVVGVYRWGIPLFYNYPVGTGEHGPMKVFAWYRKVLGYRVYRAMLPSLVPHLLLGGLLLVSTIKAMRTGQYGRPLVVSWIILAAGCAVGAFHAGAFPYFWMTLGLFPAAALSLAWDPIIELFSRARTKALVGFGLGLTICIPAIPTLLERMQDTQKIQRDAFAFVDRHFSPGDRGYHVEGALFCRKDPQPFPSYFSQHIVKKFFGEGAAQRAKEFLAEFRLRPVKFIISSHRLGNFPRPMIAFWWQHYVRYKHRVWIPGRPMGGPVGTKTIFEVLVPGTYRWTTLHTTPEAQIQLQGQTLSNGQTIPLEIGSYTVRLSQPGKGQLTWNVNEPAQRTKQTFYSRTQINELSGRW